MQRLIEGVHRFQREQFGQHRSLFQKLSHQGQSPHTLFITRSDSRLLAPESRANKVIQKAEPFACGNA